VTVPLCQMLFGGISLTLDSPPADMTDAFLQLTIGKTINIFWFCFFIVFTVLCLLNSFYFVFWFRQYVEETVLPNKLFVTRNTDNEPINALVFNVWSGFWPSAFGRALGTSYKLIGVDDWESKAMSVKPSLARRNMILEGIPEANFQLVKSSLRKLPFEDDKFNVLFSVSTFSALPTQYQRDAAVSEMLRVMKPNAQFFGIVASQTAKRFTTALQNAGLEDIEISHNFKVFPPVAIVTGFKSHNFSQKVSLHLQEDEKAQLLFSNDSPSIELAVDKPVIPIENTHVILRYSLGALLLALMAGFVALVFRFWTELDVPVDFPELDRFASGFLAGFIIFFGLVAHNIYVQLRTICTSKKRTARVVIVKFFMSALGIFIASGLWNFLFFLPILIVDTLVYIEEIMDANTGNLLKMFLIILSIVISIKVLKWYQNRKIATEEAANPM